MTDINVATHEQELEAAKSRALIENTAQTIFKHLQALEDKKFKIMSRWVWELLQNARDVAPMNAALRVHLSVEPDHLSFRHNGRPFTNEEISHLIYHGSTKHIESESDSIGHFGSGFISTHLLSKRIYISGQMTNDCRFKFCLNREAASAVELTRVMDCSWEEFKTSLTPANEISSENYTTEYIYPLTSENTNVVEVGVTSLQSCAPYLLAFNQSLTSIEIQTGGQTVSMQKAQPEEIDNGISLIEIKSNSIQSGVDQRYVVICTEEDVSVAALLMPIGEKLAFNVEASMPKIFLAFPLYGTDKFGFPAVINSESFKPDEERGGIFLGMGESEGNIKNKQLVSKACGLLLKLISISVAKHWNNSKTLARLDHAVEQSWLDSGWYNQLIQNQLINPIRQSRMIWNANSVPISPCDSWIPLGTEKIEHEELWDITAEMLDATDKLPYRDESCQWEEILIGWASYLACRPEELQEGWTIKKLAEQVSKLGSIPSLRSALRIGSEPIDWLSNLHNLVIKADLKILFDDLKILPDQHEILRRRNEISVDSGIDEGLKDIAERIGIDVRSELLHPAARTGTISSLLSEHRTEEQVLDLILKEVRKQATAAPDDNFISVNASLFAWLVVRERWQDLESYPVITEESQGGANEILLLPNQKSSDEDLPLAPVPHWPVETRDFADLFPGRFILRADPYGDIIPAEAWPKLAMQGLVRINPLYQSHKSVSAFLPDEPLSDEEKVEHRSTSPVTQSFIAYLRKTDIGLIDSARKSRTKSIQLFKFILQFVLKEDQAAFEAPEIECECGENHRYFRAGWLPPLKNLSWVSIGRNRSSKPTAESLADLIQQDKDLSTLLRGEGPLEFIKALGISPAELSLRSFTNDEDSRVSLIRSLADITEATGHDVDRVAKLANAVKGDPELIDFVEERAKERSRIRRNQDVGRTVEQLLSSALSSRGLRVTRTGVGSDYEVESDVIEDSKEVLLQVDKGSKSYLIEIKATTGTTARMTAKQAEVASQEKDHFVLCMVKLDSEDCSEAAVLNGARFITDIGARVEPLWEVYVDLQKSRAGATTSHGDLELEIYEADTRFKIGSGAWASGLKFDKALSYFLGV